METIYLDHNSTTPLHPAVAAAMQPYWSNAYGNPASSHHVGRQARQALETARETVAALLDADASAVVFTSGATEANNLAIFGLAGDPPGRLITSSVEHPSVAEPMQQLAQRGFELVHLSVDHQGVVAANGLTKLLSPDLRLVSVMLANNETGSIQPVRELATCCLGGTPVPRFHCDAVQAVGKIPVSFRQLGVTSLSLSAHKFQGPRGVGALIVAKGTRLRPLFWGGHQQHGWRPGTEPVALAVGLATALRLASDEFEARVRTCRRLRQVFLERLGDASPVVLNGPVEGGLPHVVNVSFPGCTAAALLMKLDLDGVACSTGSACSSGSLLPSPVLKAMGCPADVLNSAMRFSLSHATTEAELIEAAARIARAVRRLRALGNDDEHPP